MLLSHFVPWTTTFLSRVRCHKLIPCAIFVKNESEKRRYCSNFMNLICCKRNNITHETLVFANEWIEIGYSSSLPFCVSALRGIFIPHDFILFGFVLSWKQKCGNRSSTEIKLVWILWSGLTVNAYLTTVTDPTKYTCTWQVKPHLYSIFTHWLQWFHSI